MGVLPLQFHEGENARVLDLNGDETFTIHIDDDLQPRQDVRIEVRNPNGIQSNFRVVCRLDSPIEVDYYRNGGILQTVLRQFFREKS